MVIATDAKAKVLRSEIVAGNGAAPGGSSIGLIVSVDAEADVLENRIVAGNGARGADGEDGGALPAPDGIDGNPGADACSAEIVPGGPAVATSCGDVQTVGGRGGDGMLDRGGDGADGAPLPVPNPTGSSVGGSGRGSTACTPGQHGLDGAFGEPGDGGRREESRITPTGYVGANGKDGTDGLHGHGGGGGGGARGGSAFCGAGPRGGASGASGGSGGCGGKGGKGGGYGGASIGVIALGRRVYIDSTVYAGTGGDGGNGGIYQKAGRGGFRARGGAGRAGSGEGCNSGAGGAGGDGGSGGGGLGGYSIAVGYINGVGKVSALGEWRSGTAGWGGGSLTPNGGAKAADRGIEGAIYIWDMPAP
jgi:hypothetical protein